MALPKTTSWPSSIVNERRVIWDNARRIFEDIWLMVAKKSCEEPLVPIALRLAKLYRTPAMGPKDLPLYRPNAIDLLKSIWDWDITHEQERSPVVVRVGQYLAKLLD